jgi:hypothetical protein
MKKAFVMTALGLSVLSSAAIAAERTTDAAIGAVSGAVVFGPIGAVAGALVGYTAGPSISHSWGSRRSRTTQRMKANAQESRGSASANQPAAGDQMNARTAGPAPQPPPQGTSASTNAATASAPSAPPVQTLE